MLCSAQQGKWREEDAGLRQPALLLAEVVVAPVLVRLRVEGDLTFPRSPALDMAWAVASQKGNTDKAISARQQDSRCFVV